MKPIAQSEIDMLRREFDEMIDYWRTLADEHIEWIRYLIERNKHDTARRRITETMQLLNNLKKQRTL